jgi:hypothetical protein
MSQEVICGAIQALQLLQFYYTGDNTPGVRVVEPHQLGYTKTNNLALSAFYLSGASESNIGPSWKLYRVAEMSQIVALSTHFSGPRPDYRPGTNKILHTILCEI